MIKVLLIRWMNSLIDIHFIYIVQDLTQCLEAEKIFHDFCDQASNTNNLLQQLKE